MRTQAAKNNNNNFTLKTYFYNYTIHIFSYSKHLVSRLLTDLCFDEWKKIVPLRSIFTLFNRFSSSPLWQLILNCAEERLSGYFFYFLCVCVCRKTLFLSFWQTQSSVHRENLSWSCPAFLQENVQLQGFPNCHWNIRARYRPPWLPWPPLTPLNPLTPL